MSGLKENFTAKEFAQFSEYKQFKAEDYRKTVDFNPTAVEHSKPGSEFPVAETTPTAVKKETKKQSKSLRERLTKGTTKVATTTSVATTVAAAVGSVIVLSTVFAPTPTIELPQLDVGHDSVTYTVVAQDLQEDTYYFVEISNPYDTFTNDLVEGENQQTVEGLRQGMTYNLSVKGTNENQQTTTTYFKQSFYTKANGKPATTFTLADAIRLTGENIYSIDYSISNGTNQSIVIEQMIFYATFDGEPEIELECYTPSPNGAGSFDVEMPWGTTSLQVYAKVNLLTNEGTLTYQTEAVTYTIDTTPTLHLLDTKVHLHDNDYNKTSEVDLTFAYSAPDDASVIVQDLSSASVTDAVYTWYNGTYDIALGQTDNGTLHTFSYYLADADGNKLTTPQTVTVDSSVTGEYDSFEFVNPGDVTKTYVKYGESYLTNLYINVNFASSDPEVYYQIKHSAYGYDTYYTSRQPIAVIENTTDSTGLAYYVCKDVDGITYVLFSTIPSGSIDDETAWRISYTATQEENDYKLEVTMYDTVKFLNEDLQIRVVYQDETEQIFNVDPTAVTYDQDTHQYVITLRLTQQPLEVWIAFYCNSAYNDYEQFSQQMQLVGEPYKYAEYQIYGG